MAEPAWRKRRVTIKDIARAAGVDPSTVTRALQGSERVKESTRERINELAAEMGYVPDMAARMLVRQRSGLVGLVIPDMTNPFFADLANGIRDEASKHDLRILICNTEGLEASEREAVTLFQELKVDGLLIPMARSPKVYFDGLNDQLPVIHINRVDALHHVSCDMVQGTVSVMNHLLDLGHTRIGFVRGPQSMVQEPKMIAYRQALDDAGIEYEPELIFTYDGTSQSSQAIAEQIVGMRNRPTAVFAWNDVNAIALMHALHDLGVRVPDDISIAGHDDIHLAGCVVPALTTVHWPMYELGQLSIRYLFGLRAGHAPEVLDVPPPRLIVRESTARPPE